MLRLPGSGAGDVAAIGQAIKDSSLVLEEAKSVGFNPHILNVGGGFQDCNFELISGALRTALQTHIPKNIAIIAEPGRYFARSAYTLACTVIGRRQVHNGSMDMIYQNDGVYGNFLNVIIEKEAISPSIVFLINQQERQLTTRVYSIWGPTCDSTDCVNPISRFGTEIMVGDWLIYKNMGGSVPKTPCRMGFLTNLAYTTSTSTNFNGFSSLYPTVYICSEATVMHLF